MSSKPMRTIHKILDANCLTLSILEQYEIAGKINGCGGKGGVNFDKLIKEICITLPNFDEKQAIELWRNIRICCMIHDYDFYHKNGFYKSNWFFAFNIFKLLNWTNWFNRLAVLFTIFFMLNKHGKEYYIK